jgi:hypothetical protein
MFILFAAGLDHAAFLEISRRRSSGVEFVSKPLKGGDPVFLTPFALFFNAVGVCAWPTARGVRWRFDRASGTITRIRRPLIGPAWSRTWRAAEVREFRCIGGTSFTVQLALAVGGRVRIDSGFDEAAAATIVSDAGRALGHPPVKPLA